MMILCQSVRKKDIQIGNEEVKWCLLVMLPNMMIYIENAKYSTKQLLK